MDTRLIQIILPADLADQVCETLEDMDDANWWRMPVPDDDGYEREQFFLIAKPGQAQEFMDRISDALDGKKGWRQVLLPIEAVAPEIISEEEEEELRTKSIAAARDEILSEVRQDGALTPDFALMVALSTVVAAIGLNLDQVAAVIGAMVIAPLLGPLMAFALGIALGDRRMIVNSLVSNAAGFAVCIVVSGAMAMLLPANADSQLLDYAAPISLATLALALASGAAAGIATSTAKSSVLVGVMVAAAVLPPVVASGLLLAQGAFQEAARAAFTVVANLICITLAAQIVFILKGIRPRRWEEVKEAETSRRWNLAVLGALVVLLAAIILVWDII